MMKRIRWSKITGALLAAALCLALTGTWAAAGTVGSLRLTLTDDDDRPVEGVTVVLYRVGEPDGALTDGFSGAGITPESLLSERDSAANARALAAWAEERGLSGTEKTTDASGRTQFAGLAKGVYLVLCKPGQELTFTPFLVYIPMVIGGVSRYSIEAWPKAEKPDDPSPSPSPDPSQSPEPSQSPDPSASPDPSQSPEPSTSPDPTPSPSTDPDPDLPQTGVDRTLMYCLLAAGGVLVIVGLAELWRDRRKRDE